MLQLIFKCLHTFLTLSNQRNKYHNSLTYRIFIKNVHKTMNYFLEEMFFDSIHYSFLSFFLLGSAGLLRGWTLLNMSCQSRGIHWCYRMKLRIWWSVGCRGTRIPIHVIIQLPVQTVLHGLSTNFNNKVFNIALYILSK